MKEQINVAPSSTEGHFIEKARKVIAIEEQETETFAVFGKSELVTKNHTTLKRNQDCLITCQVVYNPFAGIYQRSKD